GEPIEEAPRWILKRQIERAAALGYVVKTAAELELYCFRESFEEVRRKRHHDLTPVSGYLEDYHILQTSKEEPLIRAIRNGMEGADVPVETSKGEWGRGPRDSGRGHATSATPAGPGGPNPSAPTKVRARRRGAGPAGKTAPAAFAAGGRAAASPSRTQPQARTQTPMPPSQQQPPRAF